MSNIYRAESIDGRLLEDFLSRDFDAWQLAEDYGTPILVKDLSDSRACGVTRWIGTVDRDEDGRTVFRPCR